MLIETIPRYSHVMGDEVREFRQEQEGHEETAAD